MQGTWLSWECAGVKVSEMERVQPGGLERQPGRAKG